MSVCHRGSGWWSRMVHTETSRKRRKVSMWRGPGARHNAQGHSILRCWYLCPLAMPGLLSSPAPDNAEQQAGGSWKPHGGFPMEKALKPEANSVPRKAIVQHHHHAGWALLSTQTRHAAAHNTTCHFHYIDTINILHSIHNTPITLQQYPRSPKSTWV